MSVSDCDRCTTGELDEEKANEAYSELQKDIREQGDESEKEAEAEHAKTEFASNELKEKIAETANANGLKPNLKGRRRSFLPAV